PRRLAPKLAHKVGIIAEGTNNNHKRANAFQTSKMPLVRQRHFFRAGVEGWLNTFWGTRVPVA
ncbi:MAG: hypothetical protein AAFU58_11450, partial [Pseudomonadota bacterium]